MKLNEHEDFFIRAKQQNTKIAINTALKIYHYPESHKDFFAKRNVNYYTYVLEDNNISQLIIYRNNVGVIQDYYLENNKLISVQRYTNNFLGIVKRCMYFKK